MISNTDIDWAKKELKKLNKDNKFQTMFGVASIASTLLQKEGLNPIVVGGFSLAIYTKPEYTTRDIDMIVNDRNTAFKILAQIDFEIEGRYLVHNHLEVLIEFPDDMLAGSYDKVRIIEDDEFSHQSLQVISIEDIMMDRLRRYLFWEEKVAKEWVMMLLARYWDEIDFAYLTEIGKGAETKEEVDTIQLWMKDIEEIR